MSNPIANKNRAGLMGPEHVKKLDAGADFTTVNAQIVALQADVATRADAAAVTSAINSAIVTLKAGAATVITGNMTLVAGAKIICDTSAGAIIATLPPTPSPGHVVQVYRVGANGATIARNGSTIDGLSEDFLLDSDKSGVQFTYLGGSWEPYPLTVP